MPNDTMTQPDAGMGELLSGVIQDVERLAQQHVTLFKKDIQEDFRKLREGTAELAIGTGVVLVGGVLLGMALAELLSIWLHAAAAYGIVGLIVAVSGGALLYRGKNQVEDAAPIADKTIEEVEEDVKWLKNPK